MKPLRWRCASSENFIQFISILPRSIISSKSFANCFTILYGWGLKRLLCLNIVWEQVRHFYIIICADFLPKWHAATIFQTDFLGEWASVSSLYSWFCNNWPVSSYSLDFLVSYSNCSLEFLVQCFDRIWLWTFCDFKFGLKACACCCHTLPQSVKFQQNENPFL